MGLAQHATGKSSSAAGYTELRDSEPGSFAVTRKKSATFADAAIRAKLDELRFQPYSQLAAGTDQVTRVTRTWTVSETSGVKQVEVRASWLDIDGHTRAVSGVTMMTD